jgi:hypothetical protein
MVVNPEITVLQDQTMKGVGIFFERENVRNEFQEHHLQQRSTTLRFDSQPMSPTFLIISLTFAVRK